jgi:hypothetical protein
MLYDSCRDAFLIGFENLLLVLRLIYRLVSELLLVICFQAAGLELKENLATGAATWPYPSVYHPYDAAAFAGYPFNG